MPVTNYYTVNGRMIGESTNGVRTDYITDALGSIVATVKESGEIENTYRHKPFGGLLAKTGTGADPKFLWTGNTGSRTTSRTYAEQYNRARHYGSTQAGWTSVDSMWPSELAFVYVMNQVTVKIDPYGMKGHFVCDSNTGLERIFKSWCTNLNDCLKNQECRNELLECIRKSGGGGYDSAWVLKVLKALASRCQDKNNLYCFICDNKLSDACRDYYCRSSTEGRTAVWDRLPELFPIPRQIENIGECKRPMNDSREFSCLDELISDPRLKDCKRIMVICNAVSRNDKQKAEDMYHELIHCLGLGGGNSHKPEKDIIYRIGSCIGNHDYGQNRIF